MATPELIIHSMINFKPTGLWASRSWSTYNWYSFCVDNDYETDKLENQFYFDLKRGARILEVRTFKDLEPFIYKENSTNKAFDDMLNSMLTTVRNKKLPALDVIKLYEYFDGMELMENFDYRLMRTGIRSVWIGRFNTMNPPLYTWDIPSIVIWNPNAIKVSDYSPFDIANFM